MEGFFSCWDDVSPHYCLGVLIVTSPQDTSIGKGSVCCSVGRCDCTVRGCIGGKNRLAGVKEWPCRHKMLWLYCGPCLLPGSGTVAAPHHLLSQQAGGSGLPQGNTGCWGHLQPCVPAPEPGLSPPVPTTSLHYFVDKCLSAKQRPSRKPHDFGGKGVRAWPCLAFPCPPTQCHPANGLCHRLSSCSQAGSTTGNADCRGQHRTWGLPKICGVVWKHRFL